MATTTTERFESYIGSYGPNVEIGFDPEYGIVYGPGSVGILSEHLQAAGLPTRRLADGHLVAVAPKGRAVHVLCSGVIMISTEDGPATGRCGSTVKAPGAAQAMRLRPPVGWPSPRLRRPTGSAATIGSTCERHERLAGDTYSRAGG